MKADWEVKKLGEVCEIYQPQTISTKQLIENGKYSVYGANGIIGNYDKYNHEESEILLTCRGATCGSVNISEPFSWINGNAMVIHPKSTDISKQFLSFILYSLDYSHIVTGAAQPQITRQTLSPISIPVPPLPEQKRIVEILDQKFAQIDQLKQNAEKNLQNAKELFQAELTKAFINDTWEKKRLGEIIDLLSGQDFPPEKYNSEQDGIPYITGASNFNVDGSILINRWTTFPSVIAKKLDILLVVKGSGYGKTTIADFDEAHIARQIMALRVKNELQREFLFFFLNSKFSEIKKMGNGVIPGITRSDVLDMVIPLPPLSEQQEIVAHLEALQEKVRQLEEIYTKQIANCDKLKQSFLKKAFEGEL